MLNVEELPVEARTYIRELEGKLEAANTSWKTKYDHLVDEYRLLLYKRFGRSSEREDVTQELLFFHASCGPAYCWRSALGRAENSFVVLSAKNLFSMHVLSFNP